MLVSSRLVSYDVARRTTLRRTRAYIRKDGARNARNPGMEVLVVTGTPGYRDAAPRSGRDTRRDSGNLGPREECPTK
uniref:Uncharacterized protein n=1 Tax=Vespula pensylvanica TaxID=30213 RepID=A0A834P2R2_VESPE|nr:hypothetical protein H0235_008198 [Vespula pensylvanica]